jgi:hypothetical protein
MTVLTHTHHPLERLERLPTRLPMRDRRAQHTLVPPSGSWPALFQHYWRQPRLPA